MTSGTPSDAGAGTPSEELMTSQEVMAYLHVSRTKLWQLVKSEGLPAYKLGLKGDYRYRRSEIDGWLLKQKLNAPPPG